MEHDFNQYARFIKAVDRYRTYIQPRRTEDLQVHLFIGAPGTGKTRKAYEVLDDPYAFPIGKELWADGYMGQPHVIVDDFSGQLRLVDTLRFLDRYAIQIPKKGSFVWWCPNRIIITSNIHPRNWFSWIGREQQEEALRRRIHFIWDFDQIRNEEPTLLDKATYWALNVPAYHCTGQPE